MGKEEFENTPTTSIKEPLLQQSQILSALPEIEDQPLSENGRVCLLLLCTFSCEFLNMFSIYD